MNTKYYISRVKISPRRTVEGVNTGTEIEETRTDVERLWNETNPGAKIVAIRELTPAEIEILLTGEKVNF